jgi:hypothetical protein
MFCLPGLAQYRCARLTSNVRPHKHHPWDASSATSVALMTSPRSKASSSGRLAARSSAPTSATEPTSSSRRHSFALAQEQMGKETLFLFLLPPREFRSLVFAGPWFDQSGSHVIEVGRSYMNGGRIGLARFGTRHTSSEMVFPSRSQSSSLIGPSRSSSERKRCSSGTRILMASTSSRSGSARWPGGKFKMANSGPRRVRPNPSFEARPNGIVLGPRGAVVHDAPRGPSTIPSVPPQLER